jgi:hypothetical protein
MIPAVPRRPAGPAIAGASLCAGVLSFVPLLVSGRWDWVEAWVLAVLFILSFALSRLLAARRHPGLLAERA